MDSSCLSHLVEVLQAIETCCGLCWKIRVIHMVRIWALLYNVLENYKKIFNDSLLSLSLQIQLMVYTI